MVVHLNKPPQSFPGMLSRLVSNVAISSPRTSPDDSRQEANISRFIDCSEAQMRSVLDHDIREHNAVMTVVADKPVQGDAETSSLVGGNH